jgi:hypothetical protein
MRKVWPATRQLTGPRLARAREALRFPVYFGFSFSAAELMQ